MNSSKCAMADRHREFELAPTDRRLGLLNCNVAVRPPGLRPLFHTRHPEPCEGSKGMDGRAPHTWILRFAQDDGEERCGIFGCLPGCGILVKPVCDQQTPAV